MSKNKLIALIGTLTMAAAGLAAVSAGVSSKEADSVSAATTSASNFNVWVVAKNENGSPTDYNGLHIWDIDYEDGYGNDDLTYWFTNFKGAICSGQSTTNNTKIWSNGDGSLNIYQQNYLSNQTHYDNYGNHFVYNFPTFVNSFTYQAMRTNGTDCWNHGKSYSSGTTKQRIGCGQWTYGESGSWELAKSAHSYNFTTFTITKKYSLAGVSGSNIGTETYYQHYYYKVPANVAAPDGYAFSKWTSDLAGSSQITNASKKTFSADSTIYAYCTANTDTAYTVNHYKEDLTSGTYTLANTDNLTGTTGANTAATAKSYEGFTAPSITQQPIAGDGSTVINVYYTRNSHTLSWVTDGDPLTGDYTSGSVKYGTTIVAPNTPTKANDYVFNGWSPSVPETMPDNSVELTATWVKSTKPTYTVTIAVNDASRGTVSSSSVVVEEGTTYSTSENTLSFATSPVTSITATANDPTGAYTYAFTGWSSNSGTINAATTITANFSATDNEYSISWSAPSDVSVTYNSPAGDDYLYHAQILEPTINSMTGYDFDGWYYTDSTHLSETKITSWPFQLKSNTAFVGKFTKQTFNVAVEIYKGQADWGTISGNSFSNVPYGSPVTVDGNKLTINGQTITATANDGGDACTYDFVRWLDYPATITDGSQHIKAEFSQTMKTYSLDWDFNGGSTEQTAGVDYTAADTYAYGTPITAPTLTKEGYTFSSWSPEFSSTLTRNVTYTAQWVRENGYYIHVFGDNERYVKMSSNGGTEYVGTIDLEKGETFKITTITDGSEGLWSGWSAVKYDTGDGPHVDARSTAQVVDDGTNNHNIKANLAGTNTYKVFYDTNESWIDSVGGYHTYIPSIVNVDFDLNGKTGTAPDSQVVYARDLVSEPEDPTTTESYEFEGWYSEAACTNKWNFATNQVIYFSVDSTTHAATQKIYANWISTASYNITLNNNGGTGGETLINDVHVGDEISVSSIPEKLNNTFTGYWTEGGTKVIDSDGSNETPYQESFGTTLNAGWTVNNGTYIAKNPSDASMNGQYAMTENPDKAGEFLIQMSVTSGDKFKVYYATNGSVNWDDATNPTVTYNNPVFKDKVSFDADNNLVINSTGDYTIYFNTTTKNYHVADLTLPENGRYFVINGVTTKGGLIPTERIEDGWTGVEYKARLELEEGDLLSAFYQDATQATEYDLILQEGSVKEWSADPETGALVCPEDGMYSLYMISKDSGINYNYVAIYQEGEEEAITFAQTFLDAMDGVCILDDEGHVSTDPSALASAWAALHTGVESEYAKLSPDAKKILAEMSADPESSNKIRQFAASYDYIYGKYHEIASLEDFADRNPVDIGGSRLFSVNNVSTTTWIIAAVAVVGIAAVGVFFIYRKRKEN